MTDFNWKGDAIYSDLVAKVISSEGGYVNDPDDKGGATKYGIAFNYNQGALAKIGITKPEQVKDLSIDQAREIYYWKYWLAAGCDRIPDKKLAYTHFDTAVNCGIGAAARMMMSLSHNPKDFEAGGKNVAVWKELFSQYQVRRLRYYTQCSGWAKYGEGWTNRLNRVTKQGLAMG